MQHAYPFPGKWNKDGWKPAIDRVVCRLISGIGLTGTKDLVAQLGCPSSFRRMLWAALVPREYRLASSLAIEAGGFFHGSCRLACFGEKGCFQPLLARRYRRVSTGAQPVNKTICRATSAEGAR